MVRAAEGRKKVPLQKVRYEARVQQSARRVSWAEVGRRKQNQRKRCKASLEKQVHGGTSDNEVSMWRRCVP